MKKMLGSSVRKHFFQNRVHSEHRPQTRPVSSGCSVSGRSQGAATSHLPKEHSQAHTQTVGDGPASGLPSYLRTMQTPGLSCILCRGALLLDTQRSGEVLPLHPPSCERPEGVDGSPSGACWYVRGNDWNKAHCTVSLWDRFSVTMFLQPLRL